MRPKRKVQPAREKRLSYLITNAQFEWLKNLYPYFNNYELSEMMYEAHLIRLAPRSIKNMAYKHGWYKNHIQIAKERRLNAIRTNNMRWGGLYE